MPEWSLALDADGSDRWMPDCGSVVTKGLVRATGGSTGDRSLTVWWHFDVWELRTDSGTSDLGSLQAGSDSVQPVATNLVCAGMRRSQGAKRSVP